MKKTVFSLSFFALFLTSNVHAAWPVTVVADIPGQISQMQNFGQMLKDYATMVDQLETLRQQVEQARQNYESISGTRNLGDIFSDPNLQQYLPEDWSHIYNSIRNKGYNGLSGTARGLRDASKVLDICQYYNDPVERRNCEALAVKSSQDQAFALDAYDKSKERGQQIKSLQSQINQTTDAKGIAELQARIAAEQAAIANEKNSMDLYQASAKSEKEVLQQQAKEIDAKIWMSTQHGRQPQPFTLPKGW
jgi:type IV secretion system protein VirB5